MAVIEIRDLYKYFGDRRALGPVSASIEKGEIVGLLGLNGAGKTTTLRILACDLLPTSGTVRVGGLDVVEEPHEVRKRIGYLPDTPPLYPEMSVEEYLAFAARLRGVQKNEVWDRVDEVLELTEAETERLRPIGALSHGYRQRVGIAQAIVHQPELVILDEPVGGLDPVQIVEMRALVRSLGGERTVIVSSHILNEIHETCDRILVIGDGEIIASGTEQELTTKLIAGMRLCVTIKLGSNTRARAREILEALPGVERVEDVEDTGRAQGEDPDAVAFRAQAGRDVRELISKALVTSGFGLLELGRAERGLESVFLELSRSVEPDPVKRKRKKKRAAEPGERREVEPSEQREAEASEQREAEPGEQGGGEP